ncbi:MAG TPA: hypothetical protein VF147_17150 [Vicinamibacterales bacterium]
MISIILCVIAFGAVYKASRRSLGTGIGVLLAVGYAYGIVRANLLDGYSHLLFDSALLGLYLARLFEPLPLAERLRLDEIRTWMFVLVGWPVVLFLVPRQDILVELVGLRGNVFMLPCLVIGARMTRDDVYELAFWVAGLNIAAGALAATEFIIGIEPFFPRNAVTDIIYRSGDVAGSAYRIPSCFANAHAYGGTMVMTLPLLIGAWMQPSRFSGPLFGTAIAVSTLGIFVAAARLPVVILLAIGGVALFSGRVNIGHRLRWVFVGLVVAWAVSGQARLQRFTTLQDSDLVVERVTGSVNLGFFELAARYPMGNGLGGGGTSIPYFLQSRIRNSVYMENEYARIALEQGIPGVLAWTLFLFWVFTRNPPSDPSWFLPRRLMRIAAAASFASGLLGTGLLTAIPATAVLLLSLGWTAVSERAPDPAPVYARTPRAASW